MAGLSGNRAGALWMLAAVASFTVEAALIKAAGADLHPVLILFWRQAVAVVVLAPLVLRSPRAILYTGRPGLVLFRSGIGILGIVLAITALAELPLADASALSFTRILWIALIAACFMGERVIGTRLLAVLVGFAGVLLLLRPGLGGAGIGWPHLAALAAALFGALSILSVKQLSRDHSVTSLTVYAAGLGLFLSLPLAVLVWRWPTPDQIPILLGLGIAGLVTLVCYTRGMQLGEAVVMAPLDYMRLILSAIVGLMIFGEPLTPWFVLGAVLIILANVVLTVRRPAQRD